MEAKELMIGDWVHDKMLKGYGKIEVLTPFAIQCDIHTDTHHMDFFEPIPLTPEILKKNGFETTEVYCSCFYKIDGWNFLRNSKGQIWFTDGLGNTKTISYVHELQHALRLCGLTDVADNFKI